MQYGYARVSTRGQNEDRQVIAIKEYGVSDNCIFVDKQSGKDFNRPQYKRMIKKLKCGDVIVIKSIDRLGRNYEEITQQWQLLTKDKGISICVLDMPILNSGNEKDLTKTLIADIVLQLLSYVAQTEREFIHQRQAEGIEAARERGVVFGRPARPLPENFHSVYISYINREITLSQAAKTCGMPKSTFYGIVSRKMKDEEEK